MNNSLFYEYFALSWIENEQQLLSVKGIGWHFCQSRPLWSSHFFHPFPCVLVQSTRKLDERRKETEVPVMQLLLTQTNLLILAIQHDIRLVFVYWGVVYSTVVCFFPSFMLAEEWITPKPLENCWKCDKSNLFGREISVHGKRRGYNFLLSYKSSLSSTDFLGLGER